MELSARITDTPTAQESVLSFLLDRAGDEFTEAAVRSALGLPKTTTSVALTTLERQGLLAVRRLGRTGAYRADLDNALVRQIKVAGAVLRVQQALAPVRGLADLAVLFGSASRGVDRAVSDLDVFVVARNADTVRDALLADPRIQAVVVTPEEHMAMLADATPFASAVAQGLKVWGS
jgi:predicted nucleotidyltransferase